MTKSSEEKAFQNVAGTLEARSLEATTQFIKSEGNLLWFSRGKAFVYHLLL